MSILLGIILVASAAVYDNRCRHQGKGRTNTRKSASVFLCGQRLCVAVNLYRGLADRNDRNLHADISFHAERESIRNGIDARTGAIFSTASENRQSLAGHSNYGYFRVRHETIYQREDSYRYDQRGHDKG